RGAWGSSGRDEETAPFSRTKKRHQVGGVARQGKGRTFLPTPNSEEAQVSYLRSFADGSATQFALHVRVPILPIRTFPDPLDE
ncbi:MAG TPA: hypothetical protein VGG99_08995, partial [Acetobacteraceae bacterium]